MSQANYILVQSIIKVLRAYYQNQLKEATQKVKNIEYINIDLLVSKIEEEIQSDEIDNNYEKIVSMIESIIQD
jgi:glutamate racemase